MATTTVETLRIAVDMDSAQAEAGFDRLAAKMKNIGSMRSLSTTLGSFSTKAVTAGISAKSLASAMGTLYAKVLLVRRAFRLLSNVMNISSDLTETQNVVRTVFGEYEAQIDSLAKSALNAYGMSELGYKKIVSNYMAMGSTLGITTDSMKDMSVQMTNLAGDMASFFNVDYNDAAKALQSVFTGQTRPMRQYGIDLTQANLKQWALNNGLNANLSTMTQSEKALLRYQYIMSQLSYVSGDFTDTIDTWHNRLVLLKNAFIQLGQTVGSVLINAFKPFVKALTSVVQSVISFAETVSDALGHIFGWKIEVTDGYGGSLGETIADMQDAIEESDDGMSDLASGADGTASGLSDANKQAEKLKATILGFDELNVLSDANSSSGSGSGKSGSGGSGTSGTGDTGGMSSQLVRTDTIFKDVESSINSLKELGKYISDTLATSLEEINWNNVYKKAENFGKGLADFLNGLITPRLFYDLGKSIANSINTAFHAVNTFAVTFDWSNLGRSVAAKLNGTFQGLDYHLIANSLVNMINGAFEYLWRFTVDFDWTGTAESIRDAIGEALRGINWRKGSKSLNVFISNLCESIRTIVSVDNMEAVAYAIGEALKAVPWWDVLETVGTVIINTLIGVIKDVIKNPDHVFSIALALAGLFALAKAHTLLTSGITMLVNSIGMGITSGLGTTLAGNTVVSSVAASITAMLTSAIGSISAVAIGTAIGFKLSDAIFGDEKVAEDWSTASEYVNGFIEILDKLVEQGKITEGQANSTKTAIREMANSDDEQGTLFSLVDKLKVLGITYEDVQGAVDNTSESESELAKQFSNTTPIDMSKVSYDNMKVALQKLTENYRGNAAQLGNVYTILDKVKDGTLDAKGAYDLFAEVFPGMGLSIESFAALLKDEVPNAVSISTTATGELIECVQGVATGSGNASRALDKAGQSAGSFGDKAKTVKDKADKFANSLRDVKDRSKDVSTNADKSNSSIKSFADQISVWGIIKTNLYKTSLENLGKVNAKKSVEDLQSKVKSLDFSNMTRQMDSGKSSMQSLAEKISSSFSKIGNSASSATRNVGSSVSGIANSVSSSFNGIVSNLYSVGRNAANQFAYGMSSVHIPTPHLYVASYTKNRIGKTTYNTPNYGVNWYKTGGLFNAESIIGVGEAGSEAVLPLENTKTMKRIADSITAQMGSDALKKAMREAFVDGGMSVAMASGNSDPYIMNVTVKTMDNEVLAKAVEKGNLKRSSRYGNMR